jgi:hypothetical protein
VDESDARLLVASMNESSEVRNFAKLAQVDQATCIGLLYFGHAKRIARNCMPAMLPD